METVTKNNKKYQKMNISEWRGLDYEKKKYSLLLEDEELIVAKMRRKGVSQDNVQLKFHRNRVDKFSFLQNVMNENMAYRYYMNITD